MKRILCLTSLIAFLGFLGCAMNTFLTEEAGDLRQRNYALAENEATVLVDTTTPLDADASLKSFPKALIDGDRSTGWESTFTQYGIGGYSTQRGRRWWLGPDFTRGKMRRNAVALIPIQLQLPEKKLINQVVIYTIDTPTQPAILFGVKDLAVDYLSEEYEIPELRDGPSQIVTRTEKAVALWHPVEFLSKNKTTQKFPGMIQQNKSGKVVFRFKPVITRAIRIVIYDTNDSVPAGNRGYGYGMRDRKGIIRLQEIEVYGPQKVSTQNKVSPSKSTSNLNTGNEKAPGLNDLSSKSLIVTASPVVTTNPQKEKRSKEEVKDADFYFREGLAYERQGQYDQAIGAYNRALEMSPGWPSGIYNSRGNVYSIIGSYDKAMTEYTKAIEIDPKNAVAYSNRGDIYNAIGDNEQAIADYTKAAEIEPNFASAQENMALIYSHQGELEKAIAKYKDVIKSYSNLSETCKNYPNFDLDFYNAKIAEACNNIAWFSAQLGQNLDEALEFAKKAVELNSTDAAYLDTLGYIHYKMGNYEEAEKEMLRALELEPQNEEFQEHLEKIRNAMAVSLLK